MEKKFKYQITNHGSFNLFGYSNLPLPGIVELTEDNASWLEKIGYTVLKLDDSVSTVQGKSVGMRTVNASRFKKTYNK